MLKNESIDQVLDMALKQIEEKKYDCELNALGIKDTVKIGIAFKGKEVKIATV